MIWVPLRNIMARGPPWYAKMVLSGPIRPARTSSRTLCIRGFHRREWLTWIGTPRSAHTRIILSASSRLVASGFSHMTPLTPEVAA